MGVGPARLTLIRKWGTEYLMGPRFALRLDQLDAAGRRVADPRQ